MLSLAEYLIVVHDLHFKAHMSRGDFVWVTSLWFWEKAFSFKLILTYITFVNWTTFFAGLGIPINDLNRVVEATVIVLRRSLIDLVCRNGFHFHAEDEGGALVDPLRVDFNHSSILRDDFFANDKTKADSFLVHREAFLIPKLTEALEELLEVIWRDPATWIINLHDQHLLHIVVVRFDLNVAGPREFKRVFYNVDENLLEANFIAL